MIFDKYTSLIGDIDMPGDKSISHRALIFASQAYGTSKIVNLSSCEDVKFTLNALIKLGIGIIKKNNIITVHGKGLGKLISPKQTINCGNSGTSARLLMGLVSSNKIEVKFSGDKSLSSRPMERVFLPLKLMGAIIDPTNSKTLPCSIIGTDLKNIIYNLDIPSAQIKSAIMLAAINTDGQTTIIENVKTRDHSEIMLNFFGGNIKIENNIINIIGKQTLFAKEYIVPGDPSSAAFIVVAALCIKGSHIIIRNVCINEQRIGIYKILLSMGAKIEFINSKNVCGELVADIEVKYSKLTGVNIAPELAPSMIDEYPILSIAASFAEGATIMYGLTELKFKESDRINSIFEALVKCGVEVKKGDDWLAIKGLQNKVKENIQINTHNDHRIAMSFFIFGLISNSSIHISETDSIKNSFPEFFDKLIQLGYKI